MEPSITIGRFGKALRHRCQANNEHALIAQEVIVQGVRDLGDSAHRASAEAFLFSDPDVSGLGWWCQVAGTTPETVQELLGLWRQARKAA